MTVTTTVSRRGRLAVFRDNYAIVEVLEAIAAGMTKSRYLTLQLVQMGFVKPVTVKTEGRGRPRVVYEVTGKGRGRIALAKNWKR
jgi:predicted ArsR family transcriptional regulator